MIKREKKRDYESDRAFNANFEYLTLFDTQCRRHISVATKKVLNIHFYRFQSCFQQVKLLTAHFDWSQVTWPVKNTTLINSRVALSQCLRWLPCCTPSLTVIISLSTALNPMFVHRHAVEIKKKKKIITADAVMWCQMFDATSMIIQQWLYAMLVQP